MGLVVLGSCLDSTSVVFSSLNNPMILKLSETRLFFFKQLSQVWQTSPALMSQTLCLHSSLQKWMTHIFPLCYATVNTYTGFLPPRWVTTSTQIPRHTQPWFPHQVLPSEITQYFYQMLLSHRISDISKSLVSRLLYWWCLERILAFKLSILT